MKAPHSGLPRETLAPLGLAALASTIVSLGIGLTWRFMGRSRQGTSETATLRQTAQILQHRNNQLTALYNIFSEITETLSLRYIVSTTLRETQKIMNADMAFVRRLEGDQLVVIGALAGEVELQGLDAVPLGEGPTGRAAKRGRTMRLDEGAESVMKDQGGTGVDTMPSIQTGRALMESGIIAPLIIGAKVVGTLSCWSHQKNAFHVDDERILEMMASQVATAIVAADAVATSERRAHHDVLTELPNRLQLNEDLQGEFARMWKSGKPAVIGMADIDHFKRYNDEFGHHAGDVTLQQVAEVMRNSIRENDHLYRYGGEEFVFVFPETSPEQGVVLAKRIQEALEQMPSNLDGAGSSKVTISIGLVNLPGHGLDVQTLIKLADAAMYQAKEAGRNRVVVWQEAADIAA